MKTKSARILLVAVILYFIFVLLSYSSFAQNAVKKGPDYTFKNSTLIAGTANQVGAKYKFNNVKPSIDAIVTINSISPGISIATFDDNANGGYDEAFQPRLTAAAKTSGYAEFTISFVTNGAGLPSLQADVPATSIDVDGNIDANGKDSLMEFDEFMTPGAHFVDFDMAGTDLSIFQSAGSVRGKNKKVIDRTGIDTLYKQAMFMVEYLAITSFTVRIGLDNQNSYSVTRQRSIYFQKFNFANSFLPVSAITSFTGVLQSSTARLSWSMTKLHDPMQVTVQRSTDGVHFADAGSLYMVTENDASWSDNLNQSGNFYYRLKLTDQQGKVSYTNILVIRNGNANKDAFKVFPSVISSYTTVNFNSTKAENTQLMLADNLGRIVLKQSFAVQQGVNSAMLSGLDKLPAGQYIVLLKGPDYSYNQKVIIPAR